MNEEKSVIKSDEPAVGGVPHIITLAVDEDQFETIKKGLRDTCRDASTQLARVRNLPNKALMHSRTLELTNAYDKAMALLEMLKPAEGK